MKTKKLTRQTLIKANDDLFRAIIRLRDKVCQKTFKSTNLQVAHYWTRGNLRTRWDYDNACLLNGGVHYYWAHVHPEQFREFWIKRLGQKKFDELEIKARYVAPVKEIDLVYKKQELTELLEDKKENLCPNKKSATE